MPHNWPIRWPLDWRDPALLDLLRQTPADCLIADPAQELTSVLDVARRSGFTVLRRGELPEDVALVKGERPGIRMGREQDSASAGPTGAPWIDSNGWLVRLTAARNPGKSVWVETDLPRANEIAGPQFYPVAVADAAVFGGRWVLSLDPVFSAGIAGRNADAVAGLERIGALMREFDAAKSWKDYRPQAIVGVVSDFAGPNQFFAGELLNLSARLQQPWGIIEKSRLSPAALAGFEALVYADAEPPAPAARRILAGFAESGGLLIATRGWSAAVAEASGGDPHSRYTIRAAGRGRIAVARDSELDPFLVAGDAQVLLSHRRDLIRFWNGGAFGAQLSASADGHAAVLQLINYAGRPPHDAVSVQVRGPYGSARLTGAGTARGIETVARPGALELHLPPIAVYGAIELRG